MDNNLKEVLMPITILGTASAGIILFVRVTTQYILKKKMIEKGFVDDDTQAIFKRYTTENKYASLKWGLIIFFGGLSLILMEYIPFNSDSPLPYGLFALSLSLGFLLYFFLVKAWTKDN